jgi:hypothetical protein
MTPLWKQEQKLDYLESRGQRICWLELLVLLTALTAAVVVTAVSIWLW